MENNRYFCSREKHSHGFASSRLTHSIEMLMKKIGYLICLLLATTTLQAQPNIRLTATSLMHETRVTPQPANETLLTDRFVSFQWPLPVEARPQGARLDGFEQPVKKIEKSKLAYKIRFAQDAQFKKGKVEADTHWPLFNPEKPLAEGTWYWQYGYVKEGKTEWSEVLTFTVGDNGQKFCPPSYKEAITKLPATHPRIWVEKENWKQFIAKAQGKVEYQWYIERADKVLQTPMKSVKDINTNQVKNLTNEVQINSYLTRESRRIIDAEESNTEALIRSYILTRERKYSDEAIRRVFTMMNWDKEKNVKGDFNASALLSLCSMAYDTFYNILTSDQRQTLLEAIRVKGTEMYDHFNNYLENHIAENHIWQMTFRILTMAAFSTYGDLPEAAVWTNYCYNVWLARFPGLNKDGGWHNGDSYFTVNTRTLIEVPYFYSRLTGFDFFSDPWYANNVMYTIFQQPPFSKSGGNGSSHQNVTRPNSTRIGYLDALARLLGNSYAADFVRRTLAVEPDYLKKALLNKPGDLAWFRLQCDKPLPEGPGLTALPSGYIFPETGVASFLTNWDRVGSNAMWSFRSSPYGSTSHAIANQNAFNTFFGGKPIFYSSGHHIAFTDIHSMLCHRATRSHNTILVNGMGQRIGVEGYGWIPRYYAGEKIGYVLGDASNAYGKVISPLWLQRGKESGVSYTPENGWDDVPLTKYRRHIVNLGKSGYIFIYDELESREPADYTFMLHTVAEPMTVESDNPRFVHVQGLSGRGGASDAYLFSTGKLQTDSTSRFFVPAHNWLRADAKGNFTQYSNHWHFTAKSEKAKVYRFATIIHTHALKHPSKEPEILEDGRIKIPGWLISVNLKGSGAPSFFIRSTQKEGTVNITYKGQETIVVEEDKQTTLEDIVPELEI